jgi:hypothetical protein
VFILFSVALFAAWLGEAERRARLGSEWVDFEEVR